MTLAKTSFTRFINENSQTDYEKIVEISNMYGVRQEVVTIWMILDSVSVALYKKYSSEYFEEYLFELLSEQGFYVGSPTALYTGYLRLLDQYESGRIDEPGLWSTFTSMVDNNLFESKR